MRCRPRGRDALEWARSCRAGRATAGRGRARPSRWEGDARGDRRGDGPDLDCRSGWRCRVAPTCREADPISAGEGWARGGLPGDWRVPVSPGRGHRLGRGPSRPTARRRRRGRSSPSRRQRRKGGAAEPHVRLPRVRPLTGVGRGARFLLAGVVRPDYVGVRGARAARSVDGEPVVGIAPLRGRAASARTAGGIGCRGAAARRATARGMQDARTAHAMGEGATNPGEGHKPSPSPPDCRCVTTSRWIPPLLRPRVWTGRGQGGADGPEGKSGFSDEQVPAFAGPPAGTGSPVSGCSCARGRRGCCFAGWWFAAGRADPGGGVTGAVAARGCRDPPGCSWLAGGTLLVRVASAAVPTAGSSVLNRGSRRSGRRNGPGRRSASLPPASLRAGPHQDEVGGEAGKKA